MKKLVILVAVGCAAAWSPVWAEGAEKRLTLELGDAVTLGKFTAQDATIDVGTTFMNPQGCIEFRLAGPLSVGASYARSENNFSGEWSNDEGDDADGSVDVERTDINAYLRLGSRDSVNLRLGYRYFKYEFSNGTISQRDAGVIDEIDRNAAAKGDLTKGIDAELNLVFGDTVQFGLGIGGTYYMDSEYSWEFDKVRPGHPTTHETGTATLNGYSARLRPELSFKAGDAIRIFVNFTVQGTMWEGTPDGGEEYPGVDLYTAAAAGVRIML